VKTIKNEFGSTGDIRGELAAEFGDQADEVSKIMDSYSSAPSRGPVLSEKDDIKADSEMKVRKKSLLVPSPRLKRNLLWLRLMSPLSAHLRRRRRVKLLRRKRLPLRRRHSRKRSNLAPRRLPRMMTSKF
jgi:hypothetical protein